VKKHSRKVIVEIMNILKIVTNREAQLVAWSLEMYFGAVIARLSTGF
jgi:hypothetical protein